MSKSKVCKHCVFYEPNAGRQANPGGTCRRYPPTPVLMQNPSGIMGGGSASVGAAGINPPVTPEHTCGEFKDANKLALAG